MHSKTVSTVISSLLLAGSINAIEVDLSDPQSIGAAAKTITSSIVGLYKGNETGGTPGVFPDPYYWWESGLAWDSLINYWALTGDDTYNDILSEGLLWQATSANNLMPENQTPDLGNSDQSTWALACMTAAEHNFQTPPASSGVNSWVSIAKNVFDLQAARWDTKTCGGGLRWQKSPFNGGYNYKNAASNGNFLQLAARLAHYTGNQTYSEWALRTLKWSSNIGLIASSTPTLLVYEGAFTTTGCSDFGRTLWTSNIGTYMSGIAYMYNLTGTKQWAESAAFFFSANSTFASTPAGIITEVACAKEVSCSGEEFAYRAILARAIASTRNLLAPGEDSNITKGINGPSLGSESSAIDAVLQKSAEGAAAQCSGGNSGTVCGSDWSTSKWDGTQGLGQSLSALEILLANMAAIQVHTENTTTSVSTASGGGTPSSTSSTGLGASSTGKSEAGSVRESISGLLAAVAFAVVFCT